MEPLVDVRTVAQHIGFSESKVRRLCKAGKLPHIPFGDGERVVYKFMLSELDRHFKQQIANGVGHEPEANLPAGKSAAA